MLEAKGIQINLSRLIRYSYGGLLLMFLAAIVDPKTVEPVINALGTILAPLAAVGLGIGIYVIHRHVIGEIVLFPLVHLIHNLWDRIRGYSGVSSTSTVTYVRALGVQKWNARAAYTATRRQLFDPSVRDNLDLDHSELHVLYITMEQTFAAAIYLLANAQSYDSARLLILSGALTALTAITADIRQHQLECHMLKILERDKKVSTFLKDVGYL